jgi:2,3-bisphosphoglycerate-independent phosphoglycerate mutase
MVHRKKKLWYLWQKESSDQKSYRLKYQGIASAADILSHGRLSREQSDKEVDPYSLFYQWVYGKGKSVRNFDENSKMGKQFLRIEEIYDGIQKLVDSYRDKG